jgi:hypothetical protein
VLAAHKNETIDVSTSKGETDEEELLQAESEHDGTAEQVEQTPASANNMYKHRGTLKHPGYQPGTASAVLMKYLVKSDMERQAESLVDPSDAFFNSTAATVKTSSPLSSNHLQVKNICD